MTILKTPPCPRCEDLHDLISRINYIDLGRSIEGDPYWSMGLVNPNVRIAGYTSIEALIEAALKRLEEEEEGGE